MKILTILRMNTYKKRASKYFSIYFKIGFFLIIFFMGYPFELKAHEWKAPDEAAKRNNPIQKDQLSLARGEKLFVKYCTKCHGDNGEGNGPLSLELEPKPANLKRRAGAHSDGDFAWKIANGKGPMPSYKDILTENQIWDLTNFIQSLKMKD